MIFIYKKEIILSFDKRIVTVTGRDNGIRYARDQIIPKICSDDLPFLIVFPEQIIAVGSSFIEGLEDELNKIFTKNEIKKMIGYASRDTAINKEVKNGY